MRTKARKKTGTKGQKKRPLKARRASSQRTSKPKDGKNWQTVTTLGGKKKRVIIGPGGEWRDAKGRMVKGSPRSKNMVERQKQYWEDVHSGKREKRFSLVAELRRILKEQHADGTSRGHRVMKKLVEVAERGDVPGLRTLLERIDGKVPDVVMGANASMSFAEVSRRAARSMGLEEADLGDVEYDDESCS